LAGKQVDGILLCGSRLNSQQLSTVAASHSVAVLTSRNPVYTAVVSIPGEYGLFEMTSHLIRLGHRHIAHIGFGASDESERRDGYRRALHEHNIAHTPGYERMLPRVGIDRAQRAARELLSEEREITAFSCYNDLVAIGVLQACKESGLRVPEDIAVVGFDDIELASLVTPKLTSMLVPRYELGQMVMNLLLRVIAANGRDEEHLYITPKMVIRESCGALQKTMMSRVVSQAG